MVMALGTLASRLLGLVREILFAALFTRFVTDAWYAAFRIPNVFRRLFGEGALAVSFIPVFVAAQVDSPARARNLVNAFYTLFLLLLTLLTALGIIYTEPILHALLDTEFTKVPGKFELAARMSQIMFAYIFLVCTYAYFMAILNALGKFGLPALAPTFFNVAMVASTLLPSDVLGWEGAALAWGVIVGGIVQAAVLIPSLHARGFLPRLRFDLRNPDVWRVLRAMGPGLLGMSVLQITTIVNMVFATSLGEGTLSYLNLADRLMELPLSLVSVSIGTALLPTLSQYFAQGDRLQMTSTLDRAFRLNLIICLPAAVGLATLALPIVELLFQRGKFTPTETLIVAEIVQVYAINMIFISSVRVFSPAFFAIGNTWAPAVAAGAGLILHVSLARFLMEKWGIFGLNLSSLLSVLLNWVLLQIGYRIFIGAYPWTSLLRTSLRWVPALGLLWASLQSYTQLRSWLGVVQPGATGVNLSFTLQFFLLFGVIVFGVVVYAVACQIFQVKEFTTARELLVSKLKRRLDRNKSSL